MTPKFRAFVDTYSHWHMTTDIAINADGSFFHSGIHSKNQPEWKLIQHTGLKDRNGNDIYEGDILSNPDDVQLINWIVVFEEASFKVRFPNPIMTDRFIFTNGMALEREVIGNIYENQELVTS